MKLKRLRFSYISASVALIALVFPGPGASGQEAGQLPRDTTAYVSPYAEDNEQCLKCHGQAKYEYSNEETGKKFVASMCSERIIPRKDYYDSNHKSFSCTDCHSSEYLTFPHAGGLRMEQKPNCLDCHGGDEGFARYHFEDIDTAYRQSIHFKLESEGFSCWKCHDPHSYKITFRNMENIMETVTYDNSICLSCHADYQKFQLMTGRKEINIMKTHEWLPNQTAHFSSVRCIECHAQINDSLYVAHLIKPKTEAVRKCNECHSQNSILMASLYKFESKQQRDDGFFNGALLSGSYVIGANRNKYLNIISLVIFAGVIGVVAGHTFFRIRKKIKIK